MREVRFSFCQMLKVMRKDKMLILVSIAPVLAGTLIHFLLPCFENIVSLIYYYPLVDFFLSVITPLMFNFIATMVMLEERDDHIDRYIYVTSLGKKGYMISRIVIPSIISFAVTVVVLFVFGLSELPVNFIILLSFTGSLQGTVTALLIITIASNKLEGMAVIKIASLTIFGAAVPYVIHGSVQYMAAFLPSFWVGKAIMKNAVTCMGLSGVTAFAWIILMIRKL